MSTMIDAGVNLTSSQFSADLPSVIARAKSAGGKFYAGYWLRPAK